MIRQVVELEDIPRDSGDSLSPLTGVGHAGSSPALPTPKYPICGRCHVWLNWLNTWPGIRHLCANCFLE